MITRHGSPVVLLGAFVAVAGGTLAYLVSHSLLLTFGLAAVCLAGCAYLANKSRPLTEIVTPGRSRLSLMVASSLFYVTVGALTEVWSGVWLWYLEEQYKDAPDYVWYVCYGLLGSGLVLLLIGVLVGEIGGTVKEADLPVEGGVPAGQAARQTANV